MTAPDAPLVPHALRVTPNPAARTREAALRAAADEWVPPEEVARARRTVQGWDGYRREPPVSLTGLARLAGVGDIAYQDEGRRFGLGSFKGWGGGYATEALLRRVEARGGTTSSVTVTCATDGNHGRAVAWAAARGGAACVVYVADIVTERRVREIEALGARVIRSSGNHEVASAECLAAARGHGRHVITETENATEPQIATDILAGYGALWEEALDPSGESALPTHLFVQAGVGGLAATGAAITSRRYGAARPVLAVVEAASADCIRRSLESGRRTTVEGEFDTRLAGLAAGATSTFAWGLLRHGADVGIGIPDAAAEDAVRRLGDPVAGDPRIAAGPSGAAGLGAALAACADASLRRRLGIDAATRILVIGTEGATDPDR